MNQHSTIQRAAPRACTLPRARPAAAAGSATSLASGGAEPESICTASAAGAWGATPGSHSGMASHASSSSSSLAGPLESLLPAPERSSSRVESDTALLLARRDARVRLALRAQRLRQQRATLLAVGLPFLPAPARRQPPRAAPRARAQSRGGPVAAAGRAGARTCATHARCASLSVAWLKGHATPLSQLPLRARRPSARAAGLQGRRPLAHPEAGPSSRLRRRRPGSLPHHAAAGRASRGGRRGRGWAWGRHRAWKNLHGTRDRSWVKAHAAPETRHTACPISTG